MKLRPLRLNRDAIVALLTRFVRAAIFLMVIAALAAALWLQLRTPFLTASAVEEKLYALQVAANFHANGLGATFGLSNYSTRTGAEPFVYTHLIDLPAYVIYALESLTAIKYFFTLVNILAIYCFWRLFRNYASPLVAALLLACFALSDSINMQHDHLHWPLTLLVHALAALLALWQLRVRSMTPVFLAALNIIFAATFSWFAALDLAAFSVLVALFNRGRFHTAALAVCAVLVLVVCVAGKILWNAAYLGLPVALEEITLTISNRAVGRPGYEDLQSFFNEHGIVLWGAPSRTLGFLLIYYVKFGIGVAQTLAIGVLAVVAAASFRLSRARAILRREYPRLSILAAMFISLLAWDLVFPGHSAGYTNPLFQALGPLFGLILLACLVQQGLFSVPGVYATTNPARIIWAIARSTFLLLLIALLSATILLYEKRALSYATMVRKEYGGPPQEVIRQLSGRTAYTNLSVIHLGYFANDAALAGRCTPQAALRRDPRHCYNVFESLSKEPSRARMFDPDLFVFTRIHLSGNAPWREGHELDEFHRILERNFVKIGQYPDPYHPADWEIYDLRAPLAPSK